MPHFAALDRTLIETVFYVGGITLVLFVLFGNVSVYDLLKSFYPLGGTKFSPWFVYNYLGLMVLQPFLSKFASCLSKRKYELLLLALIILCTTLFRFVFPMGELYCSGWSLWWFVCLFFFGGYLRLYASTLPKLPWGKILLMLMVFTIIATRWIPFISYEYNSLLVLVMAVCSFMWVKELKLSGNGCFALCIKIVSPHVFAIYLIHTHPLVLPYLIQKVKVCGLYSDNIFILTISLIVITILIFTFSILIDKIRLWLFNITRVSMFINYLANRTDKLIFQYAEEK